MQWSCKVMCIMTDTSCTSGNTTRHVWLARRLCVAFHGTFIFRTDLPPLLFFMHAPTPLCIFAAMRSTRARALHLEISQFHYNESSDQHDLAPTALTAAPSSPHRTARTRSFSPLDIRCAAWSKSSTCSRGRRHCVAASSPILAKLTPTLLPTLTVMEALTAAGGASSATAPPDRQRRGYYRLTVKMPAVGA